MSVDEQRGVMDNQQPFELHPSTKELFQRAAEFMNPNNPNEGKLFFCGINAQMAWRFELGGYRLTQGGIHGFSSEVVDIREGSNETNPEIVALLN
jgi:hypothetical protein